MAPTEELKRALLQQKTPGISDDYFETLAKLVDMDQRLVHRVLVAYSAMADVGKWWAYSPFCTGPELKPRELRDALVDAAKMCVTRIEMAKRIHRGDKLAIAIHLLLPPHKEADICNSCDERIECMAECKRTPHACYTSFKRNQLVRPLAMTQTDVTVESVIPKGIFKIPLSALCPTEDELLSGRTHAELYSPRM